MLLKVSFPGHSESNNAWYHSTKTMDPNTHKKNWYFFRQRLKRKRIVQRETQLKAYQTCQQSEYYRFQLNSTTQSLLQSLTKISQLQNTITHFIQIQNLLIQQLSNYKQMKQNLQSQISLLHNQKIGLKSQLKRKRKTEKDKGSDSDIYVSIENSEDSEDDESDPQISSKMPFYQCAIKRISYCKPSNIAKEVNKIKKLMNLQPLDIPAGVCLNAMSYPNSNSLNMNVLSYPNLNPPYPSNVLTHL
eukprot:TRINITY_DN272_c0_g1_i3.p1 TRINITY_DN272_c0_g1~~TRINITY_DN272_c0_g1_i3.p1  ORF type:complete len:246 (-),score=45.42 TRINITY_DN272_c0_g1_i3:108-845(-)